MKIKFIDLFAGIGGIRLGFERSVNSFGLNSDCVFTSEIDKNACTTYSFNFPNDNHSPMSDITLVDENNIPDFDVLLAGFPCQAFSIAGKRSGFEDTRGTLFFDVARIIKEKKPKAFLLENVKGLVNHKGGKTLSTIINVLKNDLGYKSTTFKVLNSKNFGLAQNRERIYIVGFADGYGGSFEFDTQINNSKRIKDIIEEKPVSVKYYLSETYFKSLINHKQRHSLKGNGFGYEIKTMDDIANAVVCGGMGKERNLLIDKRQTNLTPITKIKGSVNLNGIRKMTPIEWERLQGFPDNWTSIVADVNRYKQLGNSVSVPVIESVSKKIIYELINPIPSTKKMLCKETKQLIIDLND
jgi:DNA (cytosine-5)-methyltransferase 1